MAKAKQPVNVGGIEFDALIDSDEGYEAEVPAYPTEKGFSVSDAIILKPETLTMTLYITDTPITWRSRTGAGAGKTEAVIKKLKDLYFKKTPIEIVTSSAVYTNMAITNFNYRKSLEVGYAAEVPISFKKIIITETKTTTIPDSYGKSGASGAAAGTASTSEGNSPAKPDGGGTAKSDSYLYDIGKSVKGIFGG